MDPGTNAKCWAAHVGPVAVETLRFAEIVAAVKADRWPRRLASDDDEVVFDSGAKKPEKPLYRLEGDGVAVIKIEGVMTKGESKWGGTTSTARVRRALRAAAVDSKVGSMLLEISSPGGYVDGTAELADDVAWAKGQKPVVAHIASIGASAAYWVASQAGKVYAHEAARVGSIGVYAVVEDLSKAAEMAGVTVHVIKAGEAKGDGEPGTAITERMIARWQREIDETAALFRSAIRKGRDLTAKQVDAASTGETWIARDAVEMGLLDGVRTLDQAIAGMPRPRRSRAESAQALIDLEQAK